MQRTLGRSEIAVSALGLGCWAIGGPFGSEGMAAGWGEVDDDESIAAIRRGLELGVRFFDTSDVYGTGRSETILGRALGADRDGVVIATKFGNTFEEGTGRMHGPDVSPAYIRRACEGSLRRLGTDRIDLYQCHRADLEPAEADDVAGALEQLRDDGLIRAYGWSTDDVERAAWWAERCASIQHPLNVLEDTPEMLALCERHGLASINQRPLAMGLLSGKFTAIREVLTSDGRTLVQGALGWIWARSERTIPIPGFKSVAQAAENAGALAYGPLPADMVREIDALLGGGPARVRDGGNGVADGG